MAAAEAVTQRARARVLVVDDDESMCELLTAELSARGFGAVGATDPGEVLKSLAGSDFEAVVSDLRMDGMTGLELCERIALTRPALPVILLTAHGTLDAAVAALRLRAYDFLTKPPNLDALVAALDRAVCHGRLAEDIRVPSDVGATVSESFEGLVGSSSPMRELVQLVGRVALVDTAVLIRGESGTGKELVARALHERSSRKAKPFVALNCAAIPQAMLESELFGHVKGAFTDARADRPGLFERARGGTIFLDEVAELHPSLQPKLLRALQERCVRPVGSDREVEVDVRVVTATNIDLMAAVERSQFRADLLYRLNVIEIVVPPLRDRGRDVLLLAQYFIEKFASAMKRQVFGMQASCAARLAAYSWPGNVRELANVIERAVALTRSSLLTIDDLPDGVRAPDRTPRPPPAGAELGELPPLEEIERRYIQRVLKAAGGNKTLAARILGVDRRTLYRKDLEPRDVDTRDLS